MSFLQHLLLHIYEPHKPAKGGISLGASCVGNFDNANEGYLDGFLYSFSFVYKKSIFKLRITSNN